MGKTAKHDQRIMQMNVKTLRSARRRQRGFTLLELLVVVASLAAIAGTAVVALQDTDARASAAAHVAMMDELDTGIREFRLLNKNQYPDRFDSIMEDTTGNVAGSGDPLLAVAAIEDIGIMAMSTIVAAGEAAAGDSILERLDGIGITELRVADATAGSHPDGDCADHEALIASRANAVVAGNIFLSPVANGCGWTHTLVNASNVLVWGGGSERITGEQVTGTDFDGANFAAADAGLPVMMAVGLGPSSTLFDKRILGAMSTVPVYRHVSATEYNRFIALFQVGVTNSTATPDAVDQVLLIGIVDGAGDTKEEELGEWDGTRNTI
ncbi:MAG: prepilin-type N-terminal cleavage/methylation domain-containing protein [Gammaproteobacteria bacterium]